jgi:predicted DCC family thiol-disulfide oxidoreductase YuxK
MDMVREGKKTMGVSLLAVLFYTLGWWICLFSAVYHVQWIAFLYTCGAAATTLYLSSGKLFSLHLYALIYSLLLGLIAETLFLWAGWIYYGEVSFFPPLWILCLYALFGPLLVDVLSIFQKSYVGAFVAGTLVAGMVYSAGAAMLNPEPLSFWSILFIGASWGALFVVMLYGTRILCEQAHRLEEEANRSSYTLLVDEACPLCSQEIAYLKKQETTQPVHFVDISSPDYSPEQNAGISYETAMTEIHGIDEEGNIQTGVDAFAQVYARTHLLPLALFYSLPLTRPLAKWTYKLFAQNRRFLSGKKS